MRKFYVMLLTSALLLPTWTAWCGPSQVTEEAPSIITVLPVDAIQAILNPVFVPASEAQVDDMAAMIGVVFNHEAHAYSAVVLNSSEVVNDVVGGVKIATTW